MIKLAIVDRVKFFIERQFVKGAGFQLLVVGAGIGLITLLGGIAVGLGGFEGGFFDALWWSFLRLTDPGYLGDDQGGWRRLVSTLLTVSGYVVFLGALVAIMTQWLIARMRDFERGLTPVTMKNHVVIVGWSNRTVPLLRELLGTDRARRQFANAFDTRRLRVVVLSEGVSAAQAQAMRADPVIRKHAGNIVLRDGSPLEDEAIQRAGCLNAALVIMPADFSQINRRLSLDVEMIRSLLSIDSRAAQSGQRPPLIIAELQDVRRADMAKNAYRGSLELLPSDDTLSRLLIQNVMHPGLSGFYREVLTAQNGNELMFRHTREWVGASIRDVAVRCPRAIILGLISAPERDGALSLNVASDTRISKGDKIVFLARELNDLEPTSSNAVHSPSALTYRSPTPLTARTRRHRLLILGWNRRLPNLFTEMSNYSDHQFEIDLISTTCLADRSAAIQRYGGEARNVTVRHVEADYLLDGVLDDFELSSYQTLLFVSSDSLGSEEEADARAIVGHRLIESMLDGVVKPPQILLELSDSANEGLIRSPGVETLVSPLVISHLLARTALQPDSRRVFGELFGPGGAEIEFRRGRYYGLTGQVSVEQVQDAVASCRETLLGIEYHRAGGARDLVLNPPKADSVDLSDEDKICVLVHRSS